jgi:cytoskeletal protein CcmA (bactofilin family)
MSSAPILKPEPRLPGSGLATICKSITIQGQIASQEDVYLDGELEGAVELQEHKLTVGPHGSVKAGTIRAREVLIIGRVQADIQASDRLEIRSGGQLVGNVQTARIQIEEGAYFKGGITMTGKARPNGAG